MFADCFAGFRRQAGQYSQNQNNLNIVYFISLIQTKGDDAHAGIDQIDS